MSEDTVAEDKTLRRATFRIYPTPAQERGLHYTLKMHQRLYNAALEERIGAYRTGKSLSFSEQSRELKTVRSEDPAYKALCSQAMNATLRRLEDAYKNFFRRVKERKKGGGDPCGFPRFKGIDRYVGWGWTGRQGWELVLTDGGAKLQLSKFGESGEPTTLRLRGSLRNAGEPRTCNICKDGDRWYASVAYACEPLRAKGRGIIGIDWGLLVYATIVYADNTCEKIENPRYLRDALEELRIAQQILAHKTKYGTRRRFLAKKRVQDIHRKVRDLRDNFLHQLTAKIIASCDTISTEVLNISGMTAEGGAQKAGLNREILAASPATFLQMLRYKAEEAGVRWIDVPTRTVKPSQTCSGCGRQEKKTLADRVHSCPCGLVLDRDENAARVMRNWGLNLLAQEGHREAAE